MHFKEAFKEINQIEVLYTKSISKNEKNKYKNQHDESCIVADEQVSQLLDKHPDEKAKQYLRQIFQVMKKDLRIISKENPSLIDYTPNEGREEYGDYYQHSNYKRLMPYCQLAYLSEQNGSAEEHALKLSVLFDNPKDALIYILKNMKQNKLAIHDACLFSLPDVNQCNFQQWKKLIKTNINDAAFRKLLSNIPKLEELLTQNKSEEKKLDRQQLNDKKIEIQEKNVRFKTLKRNHGSLQVHEKKEYNRLVTELADLRIELFELSANINLHEVDLPILMACYEYYSQKQEGTYQYLLKQGLTRKDFEKFERLERQDDDKQIPNIKIDGKVVDHPGFYLMKIPVKDELHAARAACLGKLTNCCQSLSGEAGESCVIHGLTSPYGGFYVVCKGDVNQPAVEDPLLGQCWVWRSQTDALVFDSIEVAKKKYDHVVNHFFEQLAKTLVKEAYTHRVVCGSFLVTSSKLGLSIPFKKELPKDYSNRRDSLKQRILYDKNYSFFFHNENSSLDEEIQKITTDIKKDQSIIQSPFLCLLINWLLLTDEADENDYTKKLLSKIKEIAKDNNRLIELEKVLETSQLYLQRKLTSVTFLTGLENNYLFTSIIDKKEQTLLHYAAINGYEGGIRTLFTKNGNDINAQDHVGNTPLYCIASSSVDKDKKIKILRLLLEHGADFKLPNNAGITVSSLAFIHDQNILPILVEYGSDTDIQHLVTFANNAKKEEELKLVIKYAVLKNKIEPQYIKENKKLSAYWNSFVEEIKKRDKLTTSETEIMVDSASSFFSRNKRIDEEKIETDKNFNTLFHF